MKTKSNPRTPAKNPPLRGAKGQKRTKALNIKLFEQEMLQVRVAHGRRAAAVVRLFLLGHDAPKQRVLESPDSRKLMEALYDHFLSVQPIRQWVEINGDEETKLLLENERKTFNKLTQICLSNFSRKA